MHFGRHGIDNNLRLNRSVIRFGLLLVAPWMLRTLAFVATPRHQQRALRSVIRFSNLMFKDSDENKELSKWEKLYYEGDAQEAEQLQRQRGGPRSEVRVVTFDLDNTLWRTSPTIAAANDALAEFLEESDIHQPARVEKIMGELFQASKPRYCPMMEEQDGSSQQPPPDEPKAPVLLTLLRKDAIQYILEEHNDFSPEKSAAFAEEAFDVWMKARHDIIPSHLATNVESCLTKIKSIVGSSGNPVLVGAITDGNSSPQTVEGLGHYFDFCVNAEGVGVAKPDNRVYMHAMTTVGAHPHLQDLFGSLLQENKLTPERLQDMVGPWWVHIGDDFVKDVVAAKSLNMRSIWSRELVAVPKSATQNDNSNDSPTKDVKEFVKQISEMKVIEMEIGAGDFLEDSIRSEFADAIVDNFEELSDIILGWHQEGMDSQADAPSTTAGSATSTPSKESALEKNDVITEPALEIVKPASMSEESKKFCVFCGTKLPMEAKFCLSCGEKQPQI